jgi:hypothetical protein
VPSKTVLATSTVSVAARQIGREVCAKASGTWI